MAAGASPTSALMAAQLVSRLAQRGSPGGGAAGLTTPDQTGEQVQQQFSQLQNADPDAVTKGLQKLKQVLVVMYNQTVFQVPEAARHISGAQKEIDQALKAIQQASATLNAVRPQIANNAALPPGFNPGGAGGGGSSEIPATGGIGGIGG